MNLEHADTAVDAADVAPGRRQRRWQDVHDRLYDAACELFLEADFVSTSVDQIAERADVARKTAFNHFPRKRDLIAEWGNRRRAFVLARLSDDVMQNAPLDEVARHYFAALAAHNEQHRPLTIRMLEGWRESGGPFDADPHAMVDVFRALAERATDRGELRSGVTSSTVATIFYSGYFGLLYDWIAGSDDQAPFDLGDAYTQLLDIVLDGLLARR